MSEDHLATLVDKLGRAAGLQGIAGFRRVDHGLSGDLVLRLHGAETLYAKLSDPGRSTSRRELAREVGMLGWLGGQAGAARLVWSGAVDGRPAMVTAALPGVALHELAPRQAGAGAVAALGALTAFHQLPTADCPFDERLAAKLAEAARRLAAGEIDRSRLEAAHADRPPDDLWRALVAGRPADEDLVVTHGDACWPNLILAPDGRVGLVDLGRGGVADRHQDLALFIRSAAHNFPQLDIRPLVKAHYRLAKLDEAKLEFYQLLDEFC